MFKGIPRWWMAGNWLNKNGVTVWWACDCRSCLHSVVSHVSHTKEPARHSYEPQVKDEKEKWKHKAKKEIFTEATQENSVDTRIKRI